MHLSPPLVLLVLLEPRLLCFQSPQVESQPHPLPQVPLQRVVPLQQEAKEVVPQEEMLPQVAPRVQYQLPLGTQQLRSQWADLLWLKHSQVLQPLQLQPASSRTPNQTG